MAQRPYWSGQIRISLVSFAVSLQPATRRSSQMPLHELERRTGERIHHRNVTEDGKPVERDDIVKGFEVEKGEYVLLEDDDIAGIKLPSSDTLDLTDFADSAAISALYFERPYFVLPANKKAEEIYAVFAEALRASRKAGIGQITLRGREELCAVLPFEQGLLIELLRYNQELEEIPELFTRKNGGKAKADHVALARQLIVENSHPLHLDKFHDHYHEALEELIEAKQKHRKPRYAAAAEKPEKVVDFAEALRRSLKSKNKEKPSRAHTAPAHKRPRRRA